MMTMRTIIKANIKYKKGAFKSIIILTFIIILSLSTIVSNNDLLESTLKEDFAQLDIGDMISWVSAKQYETVEKGLATNKDLARYYAQDVILSNHYNINNTGDTSRQSLMVLKWSNKYQVYNDSFSGYESDPEPLKKDEMYVPYTYTSLHNCQKGDKVTFYTCNGERTFTIKGFVKEPLLGAYFIGMKYMFLPEETFDSMLKNDIDTESNKDTYHYKAVHMFQKAGHPLSIPKFKQSVNNTSKISDLAFASESKEGLMGYSMLFNQIGSGILYAFIILLFAIVVVVLCHSISTGIEMDYRNLGILKATGFTSGKIRLIYLCQYLLACLIGTVFGVLLAIPCTNLLGKLFLPITGIITPFSLSMGKILLAILVMFLIVIGSIFVLTRKVTKVSPIKAIAGGVDSIYFSSRLQTKISPRHLSLTLAIRQFTSGKKRYIGTLLISTLLIFFMMSMSMLAQSMNSERFLESNGQMNTDISVYFETKEASKDCGNIRKEIEAISPIEKSASLTTEYISLNDIAIWTSIYEDLNVIKGSVIKGRLPKYDNEISITEIIADEFNLKIGDEVTLSSKKGQSKYIVSGLHQCTNDSGHCLAMNYEAYQKIGKSYLGVLRIDLKNNQDAKKVMNALSQKYGKTIKCETSDGNDDSNEMVSTALEETNTLVYVISVFFTLVTVSMVCSKSFYRERTDIGIYKAIGFTGKKLRLQFAFRFLIVSLVGSVLGTIMCFFLCKPMLELILRGLGVTNFATEYTPMIILSPIVIICTCFFLFSFCSARKVKKVEVRELIIE